MEQMDIREVFGTRLLVSDGATGTVLDGLLDAASAGKTDADREAAQLPREVLPLLRPELILQVHNEYLAAGANVIKTATFNANCVSLAELSGLGELLGLDSVASAVYELNKAAAALASAAVSALSSGPAAPAAPRWVAGSVGPGTKAPSLGVISWQELVDSYLPQMLGLIDGAADLVLIETSQDVLQCKAAIEALRLANEQRKRDLPFIVSATVDASGRMLTGTSVRAFADIMAPFNPLAIGLNCSGGPAELAPAFAALAGCSSRPLSIMPNAGLPQVRDGQVYWPLSAEDFARQTAEMALANGAALAGGCCGSNPSSIAALVRHLQPRRFPATGAVVAFIPAPGQGRVLSLCSGMDSFRFDASTVSLSRESPVADGSGLPVLPLLLIDERSNASGGLKFRKILKERSLADAADFVRERAARSTAGRHPAGVDLCVAGHVADETASFSTLVRELAPVLEAALSLDTLSLPCLEQALPYVGGRPLINSANLEDEAAAIDRFKLARRFGSAVVCLCLDESGPARTVNEKLRMAVRLYELALASGLVPQDLFFDVCTFPVASGSADFVDSAKDTIEAVRRLSELCPGSGSILGVGNVSFGLPKELRPALTQRFLRKAMLAGLSAAIVDPLVLQQNPDEDFCRLADALLDNSRSDALDLLLKLDNAVDHAGAAIGAEPAHDPLGQLVSLPAAQALSKAILMAAKPAILPIMQRSRTEGLVFADISLCITSAMAELGRLYDSGTCPLPMVLRSADCARAAFSELRLWPDKKTAAAEFSATVVLATVRGDLHDIGKNLVGMVLESSGFRVVDLGTDCKAAQIISAARNSSAAVVAVSGLLTKSLQEMSELAAAMQQDNLDALLLCGGAAVQEDYVSSVIAPLHSGRAVWARDPFQAVQVLNAYLAGNVTDSLQTDADASVQAAESAAACVPAGRTAAEPTIPLPSKSTASAAGPAATPNPPTTPNGSAVNPVSAGRAARAARTDSDLPPQPGLPASPAASIPYQGARELPALSLEELLPSINRPALLQSRWHYSSADSSEAVQAFQQSLQTLQSAGAVQARGICGFYRVEKVADSLRFFDSAGCACPELLPLPRSAATNLSLADYFADQDVAVLFALTLGGTAVEYLQALHAAGDSDAYLRGHGLLASLTEAAAGRYHQQVISMLRSLAVSSGAGTMPEGKRYSFGYPGCPGLEYNQLVLRLLQADQIGLSCTSTHQLTPEFSITALLIPRSGLRYFDA